MNLFCNNYKTYMQEIKASKQAHFRSIGITDNLQTVSCQADKPWHVSYTSRKRLDKTENDQTETPGTQDPQTLSKYKSKTERKDELIKQGQVFWPTDIVGDKTGKVLKQFRSYIQTHKINSYIKLNLPKHRVPLEQQKKVIAQTYINNQKSKYSTIQEIPKKNILVSQKQDQNLHDVKIDQKQKQRNAKTTRTQSHKQPHKETASSCSSHNSKRVITIDYKLVEVQKTNKKRKLSEGYIPKTNIIYLHTEHKGDSIRAGHNKVYIESQPKKDKVAEFVLQKEEFTPNTSVHMRTLNSVDKKPNTERNNTKKR